MHHARLADDDRTIQEGIPVTSLPRTLLGLAVMQGFDEEGYELDVYWQPERFAVELDVYETHRSRDAFESDRVRQEDLKLSGIEMVRVTGRRLDREPEVVIERVAVLLERRRRELRLSGGGLDLDQAAGERAAD